MSVFLVLALSGCVSNGSDNPNLAMPGGGTMPPQPALFPPLGQGFAAGEATTEPDGSDEHGNGPASSGGPVMPADTAPPVTRQASEPNRPTGNPDTGPDAAGPERGERSPVLSGSTVPTGTTPGGQRLTERPRNNPEAADLLDHWGHRRSQAIKDGLSLTGPAAGSDAAGLWALRTAAQTRGETSVAPNLHDGDEIRSLGSRRGITYGRWTGGPADTLSIEFDTSRAGPAMQDDPAFRAMLERAGKAWSHRITDTWTAWGRSPGDLKGWFARIDSSDPAPRTRVRVGPEGELSTGLEINVRDVGALLPEGRGAVGVGNQGVQPRGDSWEPHFGSIAIDREYLQKHHGTSSLFHTLTHEMGHVLGAWKGHPASSIWRGDSSHILERIDSYVDKTAGTWIGANVVALHGGPAPFQDASEPRAWVDGERATNATTIDFAHSGVCASVMAYCGGQAALKPFLPDAIDFAFLADLGMTIMEETDRPETYGLAGWTDYAGFTVSVSRDLQIALADPQPHYGYWGGPWHTLDVVDLLQAEVDAFGYLSTRNFRSSHAAKGPDGTVRYAGGLIGAALDLAGLPPVTGDASLAVDLATLDGAASFTSLAVYVDGTPDIFAGGALHYPFELSDNAIVGTEASSTLWAYFYGPRHEDVAGVLHDPRAGLLASFGATLDDRPGREDMVASADYLTGLSYQRGAADPADDGWYMYRCGTDSACKARHNEPGPGGWTDWATTTRELVLASTAGWAWQNAARPDADHDFVRIARQSSASTDGARGRHVIDGYTGTLEHVAFGTGFERSKNWGTDPDVTSPNFRNIWTGVQGTLSGSLPGGRAQWSGPMVGYQGGYDWGEQPFVEGRATVDFWLASNRVDVAFSEVASRDGLRELPGFGFEGLRSEADGTFRGGGESGILRGAFFGPAHEEAGGVFRHNATHVTGSFGAGGVPDTVTLEETGTTRALVSRSGGYDFYAYDQWGFWGKQFQENIFGAFLEQNVTTVGNANTYYPPYGRIEGNPSGHNPVAGSAVWSGKVRAFETDPIGFMPVSGNARVEVSFDDATVDVDFTDFEAGHNDMSWRALRVEEGAFRDPQVGHATIEGAFYGTQHQGAAGKFERDRLRGVFGAVRDESATNLVEPPEENGPYATQAPLVELESGLHIGANVAPPVDQLTAGDDYNGVAVSSGLVQDGEGADRVIEFLETHVKEGEYKNTLGLESYSVQPVIRLAEGTSDEFAAYAARAVQSINATLPYEKRILLSSDPAPALAAIEDVPDGVIYVDFAPWADWNVPDKPPSTAATAIAQGDLIYDYNTEQERWEVQRKRTTHIWVDTEKILQAWVLNTDTREWERKVLDSRVDDSDTIVKWHSDDAVIRTLAHELLHSLGFAAHVDPARFMDSSIMNDEDFRERIVYTSGSYGSSTVRLNEHAYVPGHILFPLDREALLAAYGRFEPGTLPEELSAENLGSWDDTSFHLRGDLDFPGGQASFGVAARNGLAQPWASGPTPLVNLADNPVLSETVTWNGALLGITPSVETVAGGARLAVELATLDGQLGFTNLEHWGANAALGAIGTGTIWGDGDLGYKIAVSGNTFVQTGGDDGEVTGAFFGAAHEAMGGVVERSDLAAGFGGTR